MMFNIYRVELGGRCREGFIVPIGGIHLVILRKMILCTQYFIIANCFTVLRCRLLH